MIYGNSKYLSVPHGIPDHLKKSNQFDKSGMGVGSAMTDRNKIYSIRSAENPVLIPTRITDIPQ